MKIKLTSIYVDDQDEALAFYVDKLGFRVHTDVRNGDRFVEIRKEMFPDGNFPGSALITVTGLARPGMLIEIQGIGAIGDNCSNEKPCSKK